MKVVQLPRTRTSEEDAIFEQIRILYRAYQSAAEPLLKRLGEIDASFPREYFITPEDCDPIIPRPAWLPPD